MAKINVDALREYLRDYVGTAMMSGFPAAVIDLGEIDSLDGVGLYKKAESLGIDLRPFVVEESSK